MKYPIDSSYRFFQIIQTPLHPVAIRVVNFLLTICPKGLMHTRKLKIHKVKVESRIKGKIITYHIEPRKANGKMPCLLFFHGGGFVIKSFYHHYAMAKDFAKQTPCKVIFVDYRVHDQLPFPSCIYDCMDVYQDVLKHAEEWQIDPTRIAFGGDSAGGYLAEILLLQARERHLPLPCFTLLMYPFLDQRLLTPSQKNYTDTPIWNGNLSHRLCNRILYRAHILSPNEYEDLSSLPPCYIETAEFDSLHDEAIVFAERLLQTGNIVQVYETKGTMHGFDAARYSRTTKAAMRKRILALQKAFYKD